MVVSLLTSAFAAELKANFNTTSYYDIAVTNYSRMLTLQNGGVVAAASGAGQYGLLDVTGKWVVTPQYAYMWSLGGGLFGVANQYQNAYYKSGLGVINASGQTVLAPSDSCTDIDVNNGIICVATCDENNNYTYQYYTTDWQPSTKEAYRGGSQDTPPELAGYDNYRETGNGSYIVYVLGTNQSCGVLDSSFEWVIPLGEYSGIYEFSNGCYEVEKYDSETHSHSYGVLDSSLEWVIPMGEYSSIDEPIAGYYWVGNYDSETYSTPRGLMDSSTRELVIPVGEYNIIYTLKDGYYQVSKYDSETYTTSYGVLNSDFEVVLPAEYSSIYVLSNGCIQISTYDRETDRFSYGLLDSGFETVIPLGYSSIGNPNADGYISASKADGSSDLYKTDGTLVKSYADRMVTTEVYFRHLAFSTTKGQTWGMMDYDENVVLAEKYSIINRDANEEYICAGIRPEGEWQTTYGLYTQDGEQVFADGYAEITHLTDHAYRISKDGLFGISKVSGTDVTEMIPMKYTDMTIHNYNFIEVYDGSKYSIVDMSNNVIIPESSVRIDAFKGNGSVSATLYYVSRYAERADGYTETVLPFVALTDSGWVTVYADYVTGEVVNQLTGVRASNINEDGRFVYQNDAGRYSFGRLDGYGFVDVPDNTFYTPAVKWAKEKGVTEGNGNGSDTFGPADACTRAQIVTFLWRAYGKQEPTTTVNPFTDVSESDFYYDAVLWAAENGIAEGTGNGKFSPDQPCTRASAVTFQWRAAGKLTVTGGSTFSDVPAGQFYTDAVAWAVANGIVNGYPDGTFHPNNTCSRAEIVTFLYRDPVINE